MPSPTYTLIASNTLSTTATTVTFSSIPTTYTDLVLRVSGRSDLAGNTTSRYRLYINTINNSLTTYSLTELQGSGSGGASSQRDSSIPFFYSQNAPAATATSNTFDSNEFYIPNYAGSANKVVSNFNVAENNNSVATMFVGAGLLQNTAAITALSVVMGNSANFVSGSSFWLYGIKSS